jgi:hypothetical protein
MATNHADDETGPAGVQDRVRLPDEAADQQPGPRESEDLAERLDAAPPGDVKG